MRLLRRNHRRTGLARWKAEVQGSINRPNLKFVVRPRSTLEEDNLIVIWFLLHIYILYTYIYTWYTHISYIRVDIIHMMKYIDMRACIIYITFTFAFTFAFAFTCTFAFTFPFAFRLTRTFTCAFTFACTCTFAFTFALTFALHSNYITYMLQGIRRGPTRNAMIRTVRHRMVR